MRLRFEQQLYVFALYLFWLACWCSLTVGLRVDDDTVIIFHGWWN